MLVFHPLGGEELMDRPHGEGIAARDTDRPAAGERVDAVRNRGPPLPHHGFPGKLVLMDLEGMSEVTCGERSGDVLHVRADGPHTGGVLRVPDQTDAPSIREQIEGMVARVLIDAHHHLPAVLHGGETGVGRTLRRERCCGGYRNQPG